MSISRGFEPGESQPGTARSAACPDRLDEVQIRSHALNNTCERSEQVAVPYYFGDGETFDLQSTS